MQCLLEGTFYMYTYNFLLEAQQETVKRTATWHTLGFPSKFGIPEQFEIYSDKTNSEMHGGCL